MSLNATYRGDILDLSRLNVGDMRTQNPTASEEAQEAAREMWVATRSPQDSDYWQEEDVSNDESEWDRAREELEQWSESRIGREGEGVTTRNSLPAADRTTEERFEEFQGPTIVIPGEEGNPTFAEYTDDCRVDPRNPFHEDIHWTYCADHACMKHIRAKQIPEIDLTRSGKCEKK